MRNLSPPALDPLLKVLYKYSTQMSYIRTPEILYCDIMVKMCVKSMSGNILWDSVILDVLRKNNHYRLSKKFNAFAEFLIDTPIIHTWLTLRDSLVKSGLGCPEMHMCRQIKLQLEILGPFYIKTTPEIFSKILDNWKLVDFSFKISIENTLKDKRKSRQRKKNLICFVRNNSS